MTTAINLVRHFRHLRALVIGDAMLDTYLEGSAARLCSEGPVPVVRKTAEHRIPGGAANTAANLRALDADVIFLGLIGPDIAGTLLRTALRQQGINDQWLVEDSTAQTLHKLRILADGQYVVRFDEGTTFGGIESQQRLIAMLEETYPLCDLVIVSDYHYGVLSDKLIEHLRILHNAQPKPLLIDSKALYRFRDLEATIVTPNLLEAQLLVGETTRYDDPAASAGQYSRGDPCGRPAGETEGRPMAGRPQGIAPTQYDDPAAAVADGSAAVTGRSEFFAQVERVAQQLLTTLKAHHVAITLAEHGVFLLDRYGSTTYIPAHPVAHANDVGAGDSFASAMALSLAARGTLEEAARIGIDAASIAVTKQRTAIVQYQELLQRVSLREYTAYGSSDRPGHDHDALTRLSSLLDVERLVGRRIVFTNGVFDILHAGHVQFLRQAKALGDMLVVGINSDRGTQRLKGAGRPINNERDRMALVEALDAVDAVILFDEDTPTELIRALRPAIHVKGGDYADEALPEAEAVREYGGQIIILPLVGTMSTSTVIDRISELSYEADRRGPMYRAQGGDGGQA